MISCADITKGAGNRMIPKTFLSEFINVRGQFYRSVQIKMDWHEARSLAEYILTPTARSLATQIYQGAFSAKGPRTWSIIGPYGTGKSAFSLFLADLLCHTPAAHPSAQELQKRLKGNTKPLLPILITGQRTQLSQELLRGLVENLGGIAPSVQKTAERLAQQSVVQDQEVVQVFQSASQAIKEVGYGGLLVILDEFGKFLEFAAQHPDVEDLFVLQHLAEMAERNSPPIVLITVLHTAFIEYLHILDKSRQLEWQKIQGRFTNVPFLEPYEQLIQLIGAAIQNDLPPEVNERYKKQVNRIMHSDALGEATKRLHLEDQLRSCVPLDPFTVLILLPLFRSKLAQNERSLFAFLTSREAYSFQDFLQQTPVGSRTPLYRLDQLYDYVLATLGSSVFLGDRSHRWASIEAALQRVKTEWPPLAGSVIKVIGLLGLYGPQVGLKPSPEILDLIFHNEPKLGDAISWLKKASIIILRRHEDAYGLWEGSDVNLDEEYESARTRVGNGNIAARLKEIIALRPIVARSHYIRTGTLRYFKVDVIDGNEEALRSALNGSFLPANGCITYVLSGNSQERQILVGHTKEITSQSEQTENRRIFAFPRPLIGLESSIQEVETWQWVRENVKALQGDPVARQEVNSQIVYARDRLTQLAGQILHLSGYKFDPTFSEWVQSGRLHSPSSDLEFQRWLSELLDKTYTQSPILKNELINRDELSPAAAAARRNLLQAMIEREHELELGFSGNPPEYTMYKALLKAGGFHKKRGDRFAFGRPKKDWQPAWQAMLKFLRTTNNGRRPLSELFTILQEPPIGLKNGIMPVVLCALLLTYRNQIALYENGVFVPELRIEVFERLFRVVETFEIQQYLIDDQTQAIFHSLSATLASLESTPQIIGNSEINLLQVIKPLILFVGKLPTYSKKTKHLEQPEAMAVREAVLRASDPHRLLFQDLPAVFGLPAHSNAFMGHLQRTLSALQRAYPNLLDEIEQQTRSTFGLQGNSEEVRQQLCARAKPLNGFTVDKNLVLFVRETSHMDQDVRNWREIVGRAINQGLPPDQWNDLQWLDFQVRIVQIANDFVRLEELVAKQKGLGASKILSIGMLDSGLEQERAVISVPNEIQPQVDELAQQISELLGSKLNGKGPGKQVKIAALAQVVVELIKRKP
jgi:hypothetical protein